MKVECELCRALAEPAAIEAGAEGVVVRCGACGGTFVVGAGATTSPPTPTPTLEKPPESEPVDRESECPKCGAPRVERGLDPDEDNCPRCGLIYARWKGPPPAGADEAGEEASPTLWTLWQQVEARWDDVARHDAFLAACAAREAFVFAAERYRRAKLARPGDATVAARQDEVRRLVTQWAMARPLANPVPRLASKAWMYVVVIAMLLLALGFIAAMLVRLHGASP